jgi:hypothetical protein
LQALNEDQDVVELRIASRSDLDGIVAIVVVVVVVIRVVI